MTNTTGRRKLQEWIRSEGIGAQARLSRTLGIAPPSVEAWLRGESRPLPIYREALDKLVGIDESEWETSEERKRRARLMKSVPSRPRARNTGAV